MAIFQQLLVRAVKHVQKCTARSMVLGHDLPGMSTFEQQGPKAPRFVNSTMNPNLLSEDESAVDLKRGKKRYAKAKSATASCSTWAPSRSIPLMPPV